MVVYMLFDGCFCLGESQVLLCSIIPSVIEHFMCKCTCLLAIERTWENTNEVRLIV